MELQRSWQREISAPCMCSKMALAKRLLGTKLLLVSSTLQISLLWHQIRKSFLQVGRASYVWLPLVQTDKGYELLYRAKWSPKEFLSSN